jgi:hypothetical protein
VLPIPEEPEPADWREGREYRLPRSYLWLGLLATPFFFGMGAFSTIAALLNVDGSFRYPLPTALIFGSFWSIWTLLGVYITLAYFRERLYVSDEAVRVVGCFRTRTVQLSRVGRAVWRAFPANGSLVLYGDGTRLVVDFGHFPAARGLLIAFFRRSLPEPIQEGWQRFESYFVPGPAFLQRRQREGRIANLVSVGCGVGLIALSLWDP